MKFPYFLHQPRHPDEIQLYAVVVRTFVSAAVTSDPVDHHIGSVALTVIGVFDHICAVGMYIAVVVHHQGYCESCRLVETFVAVNPAVQQTFHRRAEQIGLDVLAQVIPVFVRHPFAFEKCDQGFVLIHIIVQTVIRVRLCLQIERLPDQVRDKAALLPCMEGMLVVVRSQIGTVEAVLQPFSFE